MTKGIYVPVIDNYGSGNEQIMHSFIISSKNKKIALEFIESKCKKENIDRFDINHPSFEKAVGIEDIRQIQKKLILKPIKGETKAIIIQADNGITQEAQNALLKSLEEPPLSTIIYILIPNKEILLPTILSRCKIIELKEKDALSEKDWTQYLNILISLSDKSAGERLKLAQDIAKNKEEVIPWLEKMITVSRQKLIEQIKNDNHNPLISQYLSILISFQKTYTILKSTNANCRLALENLFLNL